MTDRRRRTKQIPYDKTFFDLSGGLHTESSPLNFPDNVTLDEGNFEMLTDGTRRRRRGLNYEQVAGNFLMPEPFTSDQGTQVYKWRNVDNNPENTFIVVQIGAYLFFYRDAVTIADKREEFILNLGFYVNGPEDIDALVESPISFTHGRGKLFIANRIIDPLVVTYVEDDAWEVEQINIRVRAFKDLDDGVENDEEPDSDSADEEGGVVEDITNSHEYNLRNRGWVFGDETQGAWDFAKKNGAWPAKRMHWYLGYFSSTTTGGGKGWFSLAEDKSWSSAKLRQEALMNAYVPRGSFIWSVFDNQVPEGVAAGNIVQGLRFPKDGGDRVYRYFDPEINDWVIRYRIYLRYPIPDGVEVGDNVSTPRFNLEHVFSRGSWSGAGSQANTPTIKYSRSFEIKAIDRDADWFEVQAKVYNKGRNYSQYFERLRRVSRTNGAARWQFHSTGIFRLDDEWVSRPDARPTANAWFAGRLFHAGMKTEDWSDTIFFSKSITNDTEYGWCFQEADPTHPEINELIASDGGTIQIPNVGNIIDMRPMESSLLVFSDQGVWEIAGANFFSATDIRVRQITSAEAISAIGITELDNAIVYTSHRGVYAISREPNSGQVVAQNMIEDSIQTYWNRLTYAQQRQAFLTFDESKGRIYILHNTDREDFRYNTILIYDLRIGGFFKYTFADYDTSYIVAAHSTDQSSQPDEYQKMKFFIVNENGNNLQVADFSQKVFTDYNGTEQLPYLITGYDNLGDFARKKQSPIVHTYLGTTEEGVEEASVTRTSSLKMRAGWDFATTSATGKFGDPQEVYRRPRAYASAEGEDGTEGYEVVVARSKVRGRGRVLQLRFEGAEGLDCHLLGFAIHYQVFGEI